jgi:hypothetical protein
MTKMLTPIGFVDEDGKYYSYDEVFPHAKEMDFDHEAPRWLFDWAMKQVEDHYRERDR